MKNCILIFFVLSAICLAGCKRQFEPVKYGRDACTHCKMTIMDNRFAAEILTGKGRAIKFDDFGCLLQYVKTENFSDPDAKIFVADYDHPGAQFLDARQAVFIHNEAFKSPMNGNLAATASEQVAKQLNGGSNGKLLTWIALSK
jgi:copper chaperone NosL